MKKLYLAVAMVMALSGSANALSLSPGGQIDSGPKASIIPNTSNSDIAAYLFATYGISGDLYKNDAPGTESGSFMNYYSTTYDDPSDPMDATITWDGGDFITNGGYLLVKDGNHLPYWYLFDINGWDGKETITLTGFWPQRGAISHVTIYGGGGGNEVPEPATMLLFGAGIAGLAGLRRKNRK